MRNACVVAAALLVSGTFTHAQDLSAKPTEIVERRVSTIIKKENFFSADIAGLKITLLVDGASAKSATRWGQVKITEAKDDVGTDLKPKEKKSFFGGGKDTQMDDISRFGLDDKEAGPFEIAIDLDLPARKATAIASVKGEFKVLTGGEEKLATLKKPKAAAGKPFEDPELKSAGISAKVLKGDSDTSFAMEVKGDLGKIKSIEILDAAGESASNGHFSSGFNDTRTYNYDLNKPLDDTMTVKVTLLVGQKESTIPFELKDVKLP